MGKKPRSATADYAVYLVVRVVVAVLQALPERWAIGFGHLLGALAHRIDKRHREVARDNLRHAFPERDARQIDRLVRGCYRHFCTMVVEMVLLPRKFRLTNWNMRMRCPNARAFIDVLTTERPRMYLTGHFGNWELIGYSGGAFGASSHAIARTLDNPYLDQFLKKFRERTGQTILCKNGEFDRITEVLETGGILGTLADQDAGQRGLFVEFLNRPASTHKAVALMALEYRPLMLVVGAARVPEPWGYEIVVEDVIDPNDYADRPDAVEAITVRYTLALERLVRRYPEQYFWLHRRWKHQPQPRARKKAA